MDAERVAISMPTVTGRIVGATCMHGAPPRQLPDPARRHRLGPLGRQAQVTLQIMPSYLLKRGPELMPASFVDDGYDFGGILKTLKLRGNSTMAQI